MTTISRRTFMAAGALAAGAAIMPQGVRAAEPDLIARLLDEGKRPLPDVYELSQTLVLRDGDVVNGVTLVWTGPPTDPVIRIEGESVQLLDCYVDASAGAQCYVEIPAPYFWGKEQGTLRGAVEGCIFEGYPEAGIRVTGPLPAEVR